MLHTSLHNPSVKDKPTVERFISMNRGINNGGNLSKELLTVSDEGREVGGGGGGGGGKEEGGDEERDETAIKSG